MTNRYGTAADIADALDHYNTWRRGANSPAPDPVALGRTIEAAAHTLRDLEREVTHWKANHATEVRRARILKERPDMPMERVAAYHQWEYDLASLFMMTDEVKRFAIHRASRSNCARCGQGKRCRNGSTNSSPNKKTPARGRG